MDLILHAMALCHSGLAHIGGQPAGLAVSLFLAGLAGSAVHCVGLCGPFVLGQVMVGSRSPPASAHGEWRRLAGASLLPYHLGRITTYTALGAMAGGLTAVFAIGSAFAWVSAFLLTLGAGFLLAQVAGLAVGTFSPAGSVLTRLASPL